MLITSQEIEMSVQAIQCSCVGGRLARPLTEHRRKGGVVNVRSLSNRARGLALGIGQHELRSAAPERVANDIEKKLKVGYGDCASVAKHPAHVVGGHGGKLAVSHRRLLVGRERQGGSALRGHSRERRVSSCGRGRTRRNTTLEQADYR